MLRVASATRPATSRRTCRAHHCGPMSGPAVVLAVACAACAAGRTDARLSPVTVTPDYSYRDRVVDLLHACRVIVRDLQPFVFVVLVPRSADPPPDQLMVLVHRVVGTAVLSVDNGTGIAMDGQVALIVADSADAMAGLLDGTDDAVWDPTSQYYWLVPTVNHTAARSLFRVAWHRRTLVNVVLVARSVAYTYNPFNDTLTARPVDAHVLRHEYRHKMDDLHGHPVRICMFPTPLNAVRLPDGTYAGTDGLVASTLSKHMNFTPIYNEPTDGRKYGWAERISDSDFKYTGLLGDLVHNRADMTFNSVFLKVRACRKFTVSDTVHIPFVSCTTRFSLPCFALLSDELWFETTIVVRTKLVQHYAKYNVYKGRRINRK